MKRIQNAALYLSDLKPDELFYLGVQITERFKEITSWIGLSTENEYVIPRPVTSEKQMKMQMVLGN